MRQVGYKKSHLVADTGRMPTKTLWDNIPWDQIQAGQREGHVFFDDFTNFPDFAATDVVDTIYATYADASCDISQGAASEYGEAVLTTAAADDDEVAIGTSGGAAGSYKFIKPSAGVPHTIAFECRIQNATLLEGGIFCGFAQEGCVAADGFLSTAGALPDKDYVGFHRPQADTDGWDFGYGKASGTQNVVNADCATAVVNTYNKLGFKYDYKNPDDKQIKVYVDGVLQSTYVTKTLIEVTADFPAGEELGLLLGVRNVTDIIAVKLDWWKAALVVNA